MKQQTSNLLAHLLGAFRRKYRIFAAGPAAPPRRVRKLGVESLEDRQLLAAAFFAPVEPSGSVNVQLVPLANVTVGAAEIVTFGVPFTRGSVSPSQLSQVRVLKNGAEIPAFVEALTPWRSIDNAGIDGQSVRVARVQIPYTFAALTPETITVQWGGPARTLNRTSLQDPRLEWHTVASGTFVAADNVEEPDVLPLLPRDFLAKGMLDARTQPLASGVAETRDDPALMDAITFTGYTEYDYAQKNFFYTIINQNPGIPIDYKTQFEPWLYDRSSAMYELYFRSGFATALREAIRSTDFYVDHLDPSGFFTLKPGDPKYAYNESLAYTYWLLGDNRMLAPISTVVNAYAGTVSRWSPSLSDWTERNVGYKLLANEIAYEVTGDSTFNASVQTIVGDLIWHQNGADGQLPANRIDGGLYHTGQQHDPTEVSDPAVIIASPWMSTLIVDPMVRAYGVWQSASIVDFIVRMGNFAGAASKTDAFGQFGGISRYPDYLMRADGTTEVRSDTDVQHAMDVGAVAAWATYFAELRGAPDASLRQLSNDLYATYDLGVNFWTRPGGTDFTVLPPRRYGWEYKNSPSFSSALTGSDAPSQPGALQFNAAGYSVSENGGFATITVNRVNGSSGTVTVNYATSDGTATAGSDYTAASGTLTFDPGETTKTFTIPILDDTLVEDNEKVNLTLSGPAGGANLGSPSTATLTIVRSLAPAASFLTSDTTTQGSWKGVYGSDGNLINTQLPDLPSYARVAFSNASSWTWAASTTDSRALQKAASATDRIASTWYVSGTFTIDLNLADGQSHSVALYVLDWDALQRAERIDVLDASSAVVLDSRSASGFANGQYLVWNLSGHVKINVTRTGGANAVLGGLFFGSTQAANAAPVLSVIGNKTINEQTLLTFTATATDPDLPANTLTFTLDAGAPADASITTAGVFTWTPTDAQGPGVFTITVRVTDNGSPHLSAFETIQVTVNEANVVPVLNPIGNKSVNEQTLLTFTATASDVDLPANTLTYSLDAGFPTGANINPTTGVFTWTPTELQGPGLFPITVRVTDNGTPSLSAFETIQVMVNEVNQAPILAAIGSKSVNKGNVLTFTASASDADLPANTLSFSFDVGAPTGASITAGGLFTWTPTDAQGPGVFPITIRVTDNGSPNLRAFETIQVTVNGVNTVSTLWNSNIVPAIVSSPDASAIEVGVKFTSDVSGTVTGVRFYKGSLNIGTHIGNLWNSAGVLLATATFVNESTSGWQQVNFATPVAIAANTVYLVSYHTDVGHYSYTGFYFSNAGVDNAPLHAPANSANQANAVYRYGASAFPNFAANAKNFWVDVVFTAGSAAPIPAPVANAGPAKSGNEGAAVQFSGSVTNGAAPLTYSWNFGDGTTDSGTLTPSHIYNDNGIFTATLTVTDAQNRTSTSSTTVTIANVAPTAVVGGPYAGTTGVAIAFAGSATDPSSADTAAGFTYLWNFGDGSTSTVQNPSHPYAAVGTYTVTLTATDKNGAVSTTSSTAATVTSAGSTSYSLWNASTVPTIVSSPDFSAIEVGVKFTSDVSGFVTGVHFYKGSLNTGTHIGNLWNSAGVLLATATFVNESASGWQQVNFATPVAIAANTVYLVSYHTDVGHYSYTGYYFSNAGVDNAPLHAPANSATQANAVYRYGASAFPNFAANAKNFWVDVVFNASE